MQKRNHGGLAVIIGMALSACGGGSAGSDPAIGSAVSAAPAPPQPAAGPVAGTTPAATVQPVAMPGPASPLGAKVNAPPVIGGAPTTLLSTETRYDFQPSASDPDADPLRFSALNLPPWASLDPATGRISGQPGPMDAGLYGPITLSVSDGAHQVALPDFEIRVETAPARGRIKLAWQLPSTNEDGSAINQVLLTRIYFGRGSRAYQGAYTVPGPGTTKYVLKGLQPGTWYVATTAVDPDGLESVFSDETVAVVN